MAAFRKTSPGAQLERRMLLEMRLASRIGATLYLPCHAFLAALDFRYAPSPVQGLFVRAVSAAIVWALVWVLHRRIEDTGWVRAMTYLVYFAAMAPVFWIGESMPGTFLVGFLPTLVALAIFLPSHAIDLWTVTGVCSAAAAAFLARHGNAIGTIPPVYLFTALVNMTVIAAGGSYLASRRRAEVVQWIATAQRFEDVWRFAEDLGSLGLLRPEQMIELHRLTAAQDDYGREQFLGDLVVRGQITAFQAQTVASRGLAALRIGDWLVVDKQGEGGMGEILRVRHLKSGREAALKRLLPAAQGQPSLVARFRREARVASVLDHPNVVRILEVVEDGGFPAMVMEFVTGGSLEDLLRSGRRLRADELRRLARDVASSLEHASRHGLVHRDLKPGNILLDRSGAAKLSDFGIVQVLQDGNTALTQSGVVMGTLDYMAPEQATDPSGVDIRADLYSLGCTLYHCIAGRPPFEADTPVRLILAHQRLEARDLDQCVPDVPADLAAIVRRLLAKRPEDRFQTPAELLAALEATAAA